MSEHYNCVFSIIALLVTQYHYLSIRPRIRLDLDMEKVYFEPMDRHGSTLKLSQADEEKELEFELDYLASLTFEERPKMMRQKILVFPREQEITCLLC